MAKWEDKDPKWIVQERQDGSNVNGEVKQQDKSQSVRSVGSRAPSANTGWHWEEKNQMGWSKQKLEELLVGMLVDMSAVQGNAKVTLLKDLKGEVCHSLPLMLSHCSKQLVWYHANLHFVGTP